MPESSEKRGPAGRRSLPVADRKRFALRLYGAILDRFGSFEKFKRELASRQKRKVIRTTESTVRGWLPPLQKLDKDPKFGELVRSMDWRELKTPDLASLREVSSVLDVSVDYLLGFPVPAKRSERELVSDLAWTLVRYVVKDYDRRAKSRRRDGLAATLGGKLTERNEMPMRPDWQEFTEPGEMVGGGIVTNRSVFGLQILRLDAAAFLQKVSEQASEAADKWESDHKEEERASVRRHVAELQSIATEVAEAESFLRHAPVTETDVLRRLLAVSLNPLETKRQSDLWMMRENIASAKNRKEVLDSSVEEVVREAVTHSLKGVSIADDPESALYEQR